MGLLNEANLLLNGPEAKSFSRAFEAFINIGSWRGSAPISSQEFVREPEHSYEPIVQVYRTIRPMYPYGTQDILHLNMESVGPHSFHLGTLRSWSHADQSSVLGIEGSVVYYHLRDKGMLASSLGLRDFEAIRARVGLFQKYFSGEWIVGWKSLVLDKDSHLMLPVLSEGSSGGPTITWIPLGTNVGRYHVTWLFQ